MPYTEPSLNAQRSGVALFLAIGWENISLKGNDPMILIDLVAELPI